MKEVAIIDRYWSHFKKKRMTKN